MTMPTLSWFSRVERTKDKQVIVAHCVEHDLCVQGATHEQVGERIDRLLCGHVLISKQLGMEPFADLPVGRFREAQRVTTTSIHDDGGHQRKRRGAC